MSLGRLFNEISSLFHRMLQTAECSPSVGISEDEGVLTIHSERSHRKVYGQADQGGVR